MYSSKNKSGSYQQSGSNSSYQTSSNGFTTLYNAYKSESATTSRGGALTSSNFSSLKDTPMQQHLQVISPETSRSVGGRSLQTVSLSNVPPNERQYGGYVSLGSLSSVPPMCK